MGRAKAAIAAAGGATAAAQQGLARIGNAAELAEMQKQAMGAAGVGAWQTPVPTPPPAPDAETRLQQLEELRNKGLLDAAEYESKKQQIINEL